MIKSYFKFASASIFILLCSNVHSFNEENRLLDDLLSLYSYPARPVKNFNDNLHVNLRYKLIQIQSLNMKDQVLTLIVLVEHEWTVHKFQWDPHDYGGITHTNVPSNRLWQPDFRLTQGDYESMGSLFEVHFNGSVRWTPRVKLVSFCLIELRYYPFDIQTCSLTITSWTYDGNKLSPRLMDLHDVNELGTGLLPVGMSLEDYQHSTEWELVSIPAKVIAKFYYCCEEPYYNFEFNVTLRRYPYFYLTNLVLPLLLLSHLSMVVFYLPADSCEKITLCVTILASQVMFLLLMIDNIPVTSLAVPLLGKVIIFNMLLVFLSLVCTIIVLNIHFRNPNTHRLPGWVSRLRCSVIPKLLFLEVIPTNIRESKSSNAAKDESVNERAGKTPNSKTKLKELSRLCSLSLIEIRTCADGQTKNKETLENGKYFKQFLQNALANIYYVRNYVQRLDEQTHTCEEWKFLASVLDRIFLIAFNTAFITGNFLIMKDAEALFDQRKAIDILPHDRVSTPFYTATNLTYNEMNDIDYE